MYIYMMQTKQTFFLPCVLLLKFSYELTTCPQNAVMVMNYSVPKRMDKRPLRSSMNYNVWRTACFDTFRASSLLNWLEISFYFIRLFALTCRSILRSALLLIGLGKPIPSFRLDLSPLCKHFWYLVTAFRKQLIRRIFF